MRSGQVTRRGAETRTRIINAAADLIFLNGVRGTTLDDVMASSATSKSQLYHYFVDKEALVDAVVVEQTRRVVAVHEPLLAEMDSLADLRRWRDAVVDLVRTNGGIGGCPVGSLASEMAECSEGARILLAQSFVTWEALLGEGFTAMQVSGELKPSSDPQDLATAVMAALQGGQLLTQTSRDIRPFELALDMALVHVAGHAAITPGERAGDSTASVPTHT
jgi:TetR/AcrR family transcriptional repressor of nem operon